MAHSNVLRVAPFLALSLLAFATTEARAEQSDPLADFTAGARKTCLSTASWANTSCQLVEVLDHCREGSADACIFGAKVNLTTQVHDVGRGAASRALFLRACTLDAEACVPAAHSVMSGLVDVELAKLLLRKGCARSATVCRSAGWMFVNGKEMPRDFEEASRFMNAACTGGDQRACAVLPELRSAPRSTSQSSAR